MRDTWEQDALELREKARAASRELKRTLRVPVSVAINEPDYIRAGVATRELTPAFPVYLDGYWGERRAERARDTPRAKALVLDDGRTRVALVISDIIGYYSQWVGPARAKQTAVPASNVLLATTHTHSSPCLLGMFGPPGSVDRAYVDWLGVQMSAAIEEAAQRLRPVRIGFGRSEFPVVNGEIPNFARNWHNPGVIDPAVLVMRLVDAESSDAIATLINFGNHPDVLGDQTVELSCDFLAPMYEGVSREIGGETLFFQRALGGVEPIPQGVNNPAELEAGLNGVAAVATKAVLEAVSRVEFPDVRRITWRTTECAFPITSGEALKAYGSGILPIKAEEGVQRTEMALLEIGPARFLSVPGEPHPEVLAKLSDMLGCQYDFVLAMAQDEVGYIVAGELFNPAGIQELLSAGKDNERVVLAAAAKLLGVDGYLRPSCLESAKDGLHA